MEGGIPEEEGEELLQEAVAGDLKGGLGGEVVVAEVPILEAVVVERTSSKSRGGCKVVES